MRVVSLLSLLAVSAAAAALKPGQGELPAEESYRGGLEEVVVTGSAPPKWRPREPEAPNWREKKFELPDAPEPRMQWFPEYEVQERDKYQGVRDRMGEKPEIKVFEFRF